MNTFHEGDLACALRMTVMARRAPNADTVNQSVIVTLDDSTSMRDAAADATRFVARARECGIDAHAFLPDGLLPTRIAEMIRERSDAGVMPQAIAIENVGVYAIGGDRDETAAILGALADGSRYAPPSRRHATGRLAGRIVAITGGAQGFGKGIAEALLAEGATVAIADLNDALGDAVERELNERAGRRAVMYAHADVADSESMRACIIRVTREFGGIDIFVANAGVLKAGALHEMDQAAFDFVTRVNYTGFFVCVKAVAELMKLQHTLFPDHVMDIVQINSKSGLEGSNKNFAYAGSKFGGIGLTQSFALELIPWGIKVNAICPGNYFEGPLWSDPDNGLFAQYLRAGKVPGARTLDDVRRFYVDKVPLKRGCAPHDVARAILYAHEQTYETGQAIPVTGGQVMLH